MARDEEQNPDVPFPWTPGAVTVDDGSYVVDPGMARDQEEKRRAYQVLIDLETASHRAQAQWEIANQNVKWVDEDGEAVSLAAVIEKLLPDEELRKSSGRARQKAAFPEAAQAMMDIGIPESEVVRCADTGKSSVLGIVSSTQAALARTEPDETELKEKYQSLIEMASTPQTLDELEDAAARLVNPTAPEKLKIAYSVEPGDGERMWVVLRIDVPEMRRLFFRRLHDVLELETSTLFETITKKWRSA